ALLLATSVFALSRPALLCAQETELRGEVSESTILDDQQYKIRQSSMAGTQAAQAAATANDNTPLPTYRPASPGALPDDGTGEAATTG
ncbi:MAG: hypothetical protein E5W81_34065, partial [Mesorhizobium sp.]